MLFSPAPVTGMQGFKRTEMRSDKEANRLMGFHWEWKTVLPFQRANLS